MCNYLRKDIKAIIIVIAVVTVTCMIALTQAT